MPFFQQPNGFNKITARNAGIASLFAIERHRPGVREFVKR